MIADFNDSMASRKAFVFHFMFSAGAVVMSGASVLGIAWTASAALFVLIYWMVIKKRSWVELLRVNWIALALSALCIGVLLAHDVSKFLEGNRPILLYESDIQTIIFSSYASAGLLGVGPGMLDLRNNGATALSGYMPTLALCSLLIGLVAIGGLIEIRRRLGIPALLLLLGCTLLPILFTFILGIVLHWRVVARPSDAYSPIVWSALRIWARLVVASPARRVDGN
jgi:hypothetical protein